MAYTYARGGAPMSPAGGGGSSFISSARSGSPYGDYAFKGFQGIIGENTGDPTRNPYFEYYAPKYEQDIAAQFANRGTYGSTLAAKAQADAKERLAADLWRQQMGYRMAALQGIAGMRDYRAESSGQGGADALEAQKARLAGMQGQAFVAEQMGRYGNEIPKWMGGGVTGYEGPSSRYAMSNPEAYAAEYGMNPQAAGMYYDPSIGQMVPGGYTYGQEGYAPTPYQAAGLAPTYGGTVGEFED